MAGVLAAAGRLAWLDVGAADATILDIWSAGHDHRQGAPTSNHNLNPARLWLTPVACVPSIATRRAKSYSRCWNTTGR